MCLVGSVDHQVIEVVKSVDFWIISLLAYLLRSIVAIEMVLMEGEIWETSLGYTYSHTFSFSNASQWTSKAILMSSACYEKMYKNVLDALLLSLFAVNCHLLSISPKYPTVWAMEVFVIVVSIPGSYHYHNNIILAV